jgi:3-hydroxyisobutyrate dehydrogenase-like beta-hydroxyacid dehydrogenase
VAKICNNLAMAISMIGVSEAFSLGQNLGVKASVLANVFNSSSARCWSRYIMTNYILAYPLVLY